MPPFPPLIALLLRQWRVARGFTQEQLADIADVSVRAISNIERGINAAPQRATIRSLADALQLTGADRAHFVGAVRRQRSGSGMPHEPDFLRLTPLPVPFTPLLGREHLEAAATHLLAKPVVRCLTLTGPLGVGKTRLAIQVASALATHFTDGVAFVPLADSPAISLHAAILPHLCTTNCLPTDALARLLATIRGRELLLVCDGVDRQHDGASQLATLLALTPSLKILVTSRAPLGIPGEQELSVMPLDLPPEGAVPSTDVEQFGAIAVLLYYVRASKPDFIASPAQVEVICQLCRHLDGLPLALELVAARTRVLALHELILYLTAEAGLDFLSPPRSQHALRETIADSVDRLNMTERAIFQVLSQMQGPFTVEDVCAQCPALSRAQVLASIEALHTHALIIAAPAPTRNIPAFMMLRVIRWFGATLAAAYSP